MQARFDFYYEMHRRMLEAAGGLDRLHPRGRRPGQSARADDQHGHLREAFRPQVWPVLPDGPRYGARTMMHMCGCVGQFLPRLIELGLDVYDVVQPTTPAMDIAVLEQRFGSRLGFCGIVCVQTTLAWGTPDEVVRRSPPAARPVSPRRVVPGPDPRHPGRLSPGEHPGHVPHGRQPERAHRRVDPEHPEGGKPGKSTCRNCSERRRAGKPPPWRAGAPPLRGAAMPAA